MAYQINKTDGTIVATVADGQIDNLSTDLTLIGKNYSGYGEAFNENFIKLLENFADTAEPEHPIKGQIWFDSTELKLKVYSGTAFIPVSSATISNTQPNTLGVGDLWFNDVDRQLYFFDGSDTILLGPSYSESQLLSGLKVESILDTLNQTRVITLLYTNGILLGIFAKDSFTPKDTIEGFSGNIQPGFNAGTLSGIKFDVTCTNSEQLGNQPASKYVRNDTSNIIDGQLIIADNLGVVIGDASQLNLTVQGGGNVFFTNAASDRQIVFDVRKGITQERAMVINADTRSVDFYEGFTDSQVNVGGDLTIAGDITIRGNLIINDGDVTQVKTSELLVEDKVIVLAETGDSAANTDENADGGGLVLKGANPHVFVWSDQGQVADPIYPELAAQAWTSSEHINLASGKEFKINGVTVLSGTSLGAGITSIPGVTSFGTQNVVNIGPGLPPDAQLKLETDSGSNNPRISTLSGDLDLELAPNGTGNISLIGSPKIVGMADPDDPQDAATKEYVDNTIETRTIHFSMDLSDGKPNSYIIANILNNLAPPAEYRNGTLAKILCTLLNNSTTSLDLNPLISQSTATFNTPSGTAPAVTNVSINTATVASPGISTTRIIKEFQILGGVWNFVNDTILPP